jgi:hypothetical protein
MQLNKDKEPNGYPTNAQLIDALVRYSKLEYFSEPFVVICETDKGYRFYLTKEQACAVAAARLEKLLTV